MSRNPLVSQKNILIGCMFCGIALLAVTVLSSVILLTRSALLANTIPDGPNPQLESLQTAIDLLGTVIPEI